MKNIILTVVILGVLTFVGCGKETIGEQKENTINGVTKSKIKSERQISYNAIEKNGQIEKGSISYKDENSLIIYNEQGNKKEEIWYYSDGSTDKATYKYDAKGNQIEMNRYNSNGSLEYKITYQYDTKGYLIEQKRYQSDGSLDFKNTFKYDTKGNQIERQGYEPDGSLVRKNTFKYDEKGNKIEENLFNSDDGSSVEKTTYQYDAKGYLIEENINEVLKNIIKKTIYKYNEKGYLIEEEEDTGRGYYYKYI